MIIVMKVHTLWIQSAWALHIFSCVGSFSKKTKKLNVFRFSDAGLNIVL